MADRLPRFTRCAFSAHKKLRPLLTALLEGRQREFRAQEHDDTTDVLARIAASDGMARFTREFERNNNGTRDYLRPTMTALFWRDLSLRRLLQKYPQHAPALQASRWATHNEAAARALCAVALVCWLAEAATQPDERHKSEIAMHKRFFEAERRAWQSLCANGLADQAQPHLRQAVEHLVLANILTRDWTPDHDELLHGTCNRLAGFFGHRCYGIAAQLVSAALDKPISRRHTRYAVKIFGR
jgi:hypothetical protein